MATEYKELEIQVKKLNEHVSKLQASNSRLKDDLVALQHNYTRLVTQMNERLEAVHTRFQNKA